jgi:hypothetical protein
MLIRNPLSCSVEIASKLPPMLMVVTKMNLGVPEKVSEKLFKYPLMFPKKEVIYILGL